MFGTRTDDTRTAEERIANRLSDKADRRGLMRALDVSQALVWFDADGRIIDSNPNFHALLNLSPPALADYSYFNLVGESDGDAPAIQRRWDRISSGMMSNEERSFYAPSGQEVWCSASYAAIRNEDTGRTRRVLCILIDLSPWSWKPNDGARISTRW